MTNSQNSCPTAMACCLDITCMSVCTLTTLAPNTHSSGQNKHLLVHLGYVRGVLCPSNAPSVPFLPNNPSKLEKYATEAAQPMFTVHCGFFLTEMPKYGSHVTRSRAEDCRMWHEMPECTRLLLNLPWEILEIFNARALGHGINTNPK